MSERFFHARVLMACMMSVKQYPTSNARRDPLSMISDVVHHHSRLLKEFESALFDGQSSLTSYIGYCSSGRANLSRNNTRVVQVSP